MELEKNLLRIFILCTIDHYLHSDSEVAEWNFVEGKSIDRPTATM